MKNNLLALLSGALFSIGLGISGMLQPLKIIGFLDFLGSWDPSLAFVMVGAIGVHLTAYRLVKQLSSPFLSSDWNLPTDKDLPPSLFFGATLFGVGWALGGFCPGPALVSLVSLNRQAFLFVAAMLVGILAVRALGSKNT